MRAGPRLWPGVCLPFGCFLPLAAAALASIARRSSRPPHFFLEMEGGTGTLRSVVVFVTRDR